MRKVFTPPPTRSGSIWPLLGGLALGLMVFSVLPLMQLASSRSNKQLNLTKADIALPPQLEQEAEPPPPPPPPPEKKDPPPPQLADAAPPQQLSLGALDLDIGVGTGGVLGGGLVAMQAATESMKDVAVFDVSELDSKPVPLSQVAPVHPRDLLKARVEGKVVLLFLVDEQGRVEDPRVETASRPEFEKPALEAVRKWRFRPGTKEGNPVRTYIRQPIRFGISSS